MLVSLTSVCDHLVDLIKFPIRCAKATADPVFIQFQPSTVESRQSTGEMKDITFLGDQRYVSLKIIHFMVRFGCIVIIHKLTRFIWQKVKQSVKSSGPLVRVVYAF